MFCKSLKQEQRVSGDVTHLLVESVPFSHRTAAPSEKLNFGRLRIIAKIQQIQSEIPETFRVKNMYGNVFTECQPKVSREKQRVAQKKTNKKTSGVYLMKCIAFLVMLNQIGTIYCLISRRRRAVPIRMLPGVIENNRISSLQKDVKRVLYFTASRISTQYGRLSEVLFCLCLRRRTLRRLNITFLCLSFRPRNAGLSTQTMWPIGKRNLELAPKLDVFSGRFKMLHFKAG